MIWLVLLKLHLFIYLIFNQVKSHCVIALISFLAVFEQNLHSNYINIALTLVFCLLFFM